MLCRCFIFKIFIFFLSTVIHYMTHERILKSFMPHFPYPYLSQFLEETSFVLKAFSGCLPWFPNALFSPLLGTADIWVSLLCYISGLSCLFRRTQAVSDHRACPACPGLIPSILLLIVGFSKKSNKNPHISY